MKKVLLSILKFIAVFVPFFMALNWFVPGMKEQMLADGLARTALLCLSRGALAAVVLVGGTWLLDKFKNKEEVENET